MSEARSNPTWKRSCWLTLRIYATLSTVLVSACIGLWLWSVLFQKPAPATAGSSQALFMTSYGAYMSAEYPERRNRFWSMAAALREYVAEAPMQELDLFRYFGMPDQFYSTNVVSHTKGLSLTRGCCKSPSESNGNFGLPSSVVGRFDGSASRQRKNIFTFLHFFLASSVPNRLY